MVAGKEAGTESCCSVNKQLLPLKIVLFMFSGAAFAILPYLTIHMKDIGISDIDVALIYTVLPFLVFIGPPFVGYAADKLGKNKASNWQIVALMKILQLRDFYKIFQIF